MKDSCSTTRILAALLALFVATTLALSAYLIYDKTRDSDSADSTAESVTVARYPGRFRTRQEQEAFAQEITPVVAEQNSTEALPLNNTRTETCQFSCFQPQPARKRRSVQQLLHVSSMAAAVHALHKRNSGSPWRSAPVYHGCCISRHMFISPASLPNADNEDRVIIQFQYRRQYFLTQECRHAKGCTGCTCRQENLLVTAVVENVDYPDESSDEHVLEFVKLPGCCKCFN